MLHLTVTLGRAEFYPSCTQIRVGGSQTGTSNQSVLFPGAYNDNYQGFYDPSVCEPGVAYTFPGPPVSNLASPADMTSQLSLSRRVPWDRRAATRRQAEVGRSRQHRLC